MRSIDDDLQQLIQAYGRSVPPEYMPFYIEADELLSAGVGPRSCCISIAAKLKSVMRVIDDFAKAHPGLGPGDIDDSTKQRLLLAYNGFKLLQGFVGYLPAEMRAFIAQQAGVPTMSRD
jgi:hypothetical protein